MNSEKILLERQHEIGLLLRQCLEGNLSKECFTQLHQQLSMLANTSRESGWTELEKSAGTALKRVDDFISGPCDVAHVPSVVAEVHNLLYGKLSGAMSDASFPSVRRHIAKPDAVMKTVYLFNRHPLLARDTALKLQCFGCQVTTVEEWERLAALVRIQQPSCLIVDTDGRDGAATAFPDLMRIRSIIDQQVPILLLSTHNNFEARLSAARATVDEYFVKPIDIAALVDRLDMLTATKEMHPYRVLLIGNDTERLVRYETAFLDRRVDVRSLQRPIDIFQVLSQYQPELVMIDVDTPLCTGANLSALIRQDKSYLGTPIILVSSDSSQEARREAIRSGADDVFSRKNAPDNLVLSLLNRMARYRALRSLILRDGLTGLYNHTATKEHLLREVARSKRDGTPLAFAMVDIDFFKKVNDTYGHPVGDKVLRATARLLQQRLRHGDLVGRYGGEEFAVILPGTSATAAHNVLSEIRETFQAVRHKADDKEFSVTFSAGVSQLDRATGLLDAGELSRSADMALYRAKNAGRNRIEIAER